MPSFPIIDVAVGMIFVYLTLSLVITATNELLASLLARRQKTLLLGIQTLLGSDLATALYAHPLIRSLRNGDQRPSYIPSRSFALALLDLIEPNIAVTTPQQGNDPRPAMLQARLNATGAGAPPPSPAPNVTGQPVTLPQPLQRALQVLFAEAQHDVDHFKTQLEHWFNNGMERVSGWYKRETQLVLLVLAVGLTIAANADTLKILGTLWRDPTVRAATVTQAQAYLDQVNKSGGAQASSAKAPVNPPTGAPTTTPKPSGSTPAPTDNTNETSQPPPLPPFAQGTDDVQAATKNLADALNRLGTMALPLGWDSPCIQSQPCQPARQMWPGLSGTTWLEALNEHSLGWLLTALAISLGAPFWFDMLNKVMSIRGAGKAPEEKPKEPKAVPQAQQPGQTV